MDLSKFTNKNKPAASAQYENVIKKTYTKAKNWILPPTTDKRK